MTEQQYKIYKVKSDDVTDLQAISVATFTETFIEHNTADDMQKYVSENLSTDKLLNEIKTPGSEFYFLKFNEKIAGYLKLNYGESQTEKQNLKSIEIERIYLAKEFQGKGCGKLLLNYAANIATQNLAKYIWLGVWEKNIKAIDFYNKNNFIQFSSHVFKLGNDEQIDILMKLEVN